MQEYNKLPFNKITAIVLLNLIIILNYFIKKIQKKKFEVYKLSSYLIILGIHNLSQISKIH
jgi:hypothetical protein